MTTTYDFAAADFNAVYEGRQFLPGAGITGVPWDIGAAQPGVVEFERIGRIRGHVLDAGCGLGDNAIFLAAFGYQVTAIDAASTAIAKAKDRAKGAAIEFAVADATRLDGFEGRFDTILDSALYHTLDATARPRYLRAAHRAARPGALLDMLCFADVPGGMPAPLSVSRERLVEQLTEAGWRVTDIHLTDYTGVAATTKAFLEKTGTQGNIDEHGHSHLPVWTVQAHRA
jgi:SAM-dependent methyltransferase